MFRSPKYYAELRKQARQQAHKLTSERSLIVRPDGEIVADTTASDGVDIAEFGPGICFLSTIDSDFGDRYRAEPHPHIAAH